MKHRCNIDIYLKRSIIYLRIFIIILNHLKISYSIFIKIFIKYFQLFQEKFMNKLYQHLSNILHFNIIFNIYFLLLIYIYFHHKYRLRNDYIKRNLSIIFLQLIKIAILSMILFNNH